MGWDGDALAGQMEDAMERQQAAAEARLLQRKSAASPEDRAREEELESLRLSRARIQDQLSRATNPAHRAMLERALESLEKQAGE
jgi:hypothetical protein